ncbi:MAG: hypothetical protein ACE5F1_13855 [Planctomycetota bacterium]
MLRARGFRACLAALFTVTPGLAQGTEPAQRPGLKLFLKAGVESPPHETVRPILELVSRATETAARGLLEPLRSELRRVPREAFPMSIRLYVPARWSRGRNQDPPYFLAVLDAAGELPVRDWFQTLAKPGGPAVEPMFLRELEARDGPRYLFGKGLERMRSEVARVERGELPRVNTVQQKFLRRVSGSQIHCFIDASAVAPDFRLQKLHAAGGPRGTLFGLGIDRKDGLTSCDFHWGASPGQGLLGMMLPPSAERSRLHELLPWKPGIVLEGRLGKDLPRKLRRFELSARLSDPSLRGLASEFLEAWTGDLGAFQPVPDPDHEDRDFMPLAMQVSRDFVFMVRVDPERGDGLVEKLAGVLPDEAARGPEGTFRIDKRRHSVHFGHRGGLIAVTVTPSPETSASYLEEILNAAEGGERKKRSWRLDRELEGAVQLWVSPEAGRKLADLMKKQGASPGMGVTPAYLMGRAFGQAAMSRGYGLSLGWNAGGVRVRFRF